MKTKAHTKYETEDGHVCPGVTTVLGQLNKPAIPAWANKLALSGEDYGQFMQDLASVGTLGHALVTDRLTGIETELEHYDASQIKRARFAEASFWRWESRNKIEEVMWVERPLVSEKHRFGGTNDIYAVVRGRKCLIELKTGTAIYDTHIFQAGVNKGLMEECGYPVEDAIVACIPRTDDERFADAWLTPAEINRGQQIFMHLLAIYKLNYPKTKPRYPRKEK